LKKRNTKEMRGQPAAGQRKMPTLKICREKNRGKKKIINQQEGSKTPDRGMEINDVSFEDGREFTTMGA